MTPIHFRIIISNCWNRKNQRLTIDMTNDKQIGHYRWGLNSIFVPDTNPF